MISGIVFERIPNIGLNEIPKNHSQEQIDQIKYQIIQTLLFEQFELFITFLER